MTSSLIVPSAPTLESVIKVLEDLYPPNLAEPWDKVGLSVGRRSSLVKKILFALDPVEAVVTEALEWDADLIVTHHPFFFAAVHSVSGDSDRGEIVHRLIENGCALFSAHTNADAAYRGVNEALADLLGLVDTKPLVPSNAPESPSVGLGRVGVLEAPLTLGEFAQRVADRLPQVAQGIRVAGDLEAQVNTVAVLGGSGESLAQAAAQAQADVYVTSDMKHHGALDLRAEFNHVAQLAGTSGAGRPFLIDTAHYASESPWLAYASVDVTAALGAQGYEVQTRVSGVNTDPWTARL